MLSFSTILSKAKLVFCAVFINFFSIRFEVLLLKFLDVCDRMLKVRYSLKFADLHMIILICTSTQLFLIHKVICRLHVSTNK